MVRPSLLGSVKIFIKRVNTMITICLHKVTLPYWQPLLNQIVNFPCQLR